MHLIQRQSKATLRSAHTDAIKGSFVESPAVSSAKFSKFSPAAAKIGQAEKPSLDMPANGLSKAPEHRGARQGARGDLHLFDGAPACAIDHAA